MSVMNPGTELPTSIVISPTGERVRVDSWRDLPGDWRVEFEERAAIREFDGGQAREHAEAEALKEIAYAMARAGWRGREDEL